MENIDAKQQRSTKQHRKPSDAPGNRKRAYDLYLEGGEAFSATEHWLIAEEQLKAERATADATLPKETTAAAVAGRAVKA